MVWGVLWESLLQYWKGVEWALGGWNTVYVLFFMYIRVIPCYGWSWCVNSLIWVRTVREVNEISWRWVCSGPSSIVQLGPSIKSKSKVLICFCRDSMLLLVSSFISTNFFFDSSFISSNFLLDLSFIFPHSVPSWILSQAENLASSILQDGTTECNYSYIFKPPIDPHYKQLMLEIFVVSHPPRNVRSNFLVWCPPYCSPVLRCGNAPNHLCAVSPLTCLACLFVLKPLTYPPNRKNW